MLFINLAVMAVLLVWMAVEDWKLSTVAGVKCLLGWLAILMACVTLDPPIFIWVILAVLCFVFYALPDLGFVSSADILPVAMYISVFLAEGFTSPLVFIYPICLLSCLVPYGKIYARAHKFNWSFGDNVYMPALPCFAVAWILGLLAYAIFLIIR